MFKDHLAQDLQAVEHDPALVYKGGPIHALAAVSPPL